MIEVDLSIEPPWGREEEWQALAEEAVTAALSVAPFAQLSETKATVCISIRFADNDEVQTLNRDYRHKDKPTNVLSFPMLEQSELANLYQPRHPELVSGSISPLNPSVETEKWMLKQVQHDDLGQEILLGDIILAHETCIAEAEEKGIPLPQHVTHLIIHGTLHLLGYDHIEQAEGDAMEALEVKALASLGHPNPYM